MMPSSSRHRNHPHRTKLAALTLIPCATSSSISIGAFQMATNTKINRINVCQFDCHHIHTHKKGDCNNIRNDRATSSVSVLTTRFNHSFGHRQQRQHHHKSSKLFAVAPNDASAQINSISTHLNLQPIGNTNNVSNNSQQLQPNILLQIQIETLVRILLPALLASVTSILLFPPLALHLSFLISDPATFAVLSVDSSQFVQNFLTITGLTFSILVGQTYYFMYQQQEAVFCSLFGEVTEAKSLLEQVALVCSGRRDMYQLCLGAVKRYVEDDLKMGLRKEPAQVLSARPIDDPLEIILYLTSVGVPSSIYDTVRSLRHARATRLAALQKKLPPIHLLLLWLLALIELSSFPLLGAGTQTIGGYNILTIEACLFGIMTFGVVLTLNVVGELYMGHGGAYNVDSVLTAMVKGLEDELDVRMRGEGGMDIIDREQRMTALPSPTYIK